jgi:hypothetical protein
MVPTSNPRVEATSPRLLRMSASSALLVRLLRVSFARAHTGQTAE